MRLPPHFKTKKEFKGMSLVDIAKIQHPKFLSTKTVNKYLGVAKEIFGYAERNNLIFKNPMEGLLLPESKRPDKLRDAFSTDDLNAIFSSRFYHQEKHKHPWQFWIPILALFTGCRLEELCQLHVEDVRCEDGLWVLDINAKGQKRLKNITSERVIPLHPILTEDLDFGGYAQSIGKQGNERIFHTLKAVQNKFGHYPSRWFGEYKKKCGIDSSKKVFHSFRTR